MRKVFLKNPEFCTSEANVRNFEITARKLFILKG